MCSPVISPVLPSLWLLHCLLSIVHSEADSCSSLVSMLPHDSIPLFDATSLLQHHYVIVF